MGIINLLIGDLHSFPTEEFNFCFGSTSVAANFTVRTDYAMAGNALVWISMKRVSNCACYVRTAYGSGKNPVGCHPPSRDSIGGFPDFTCKSCFCPWFRHIIKLTEIQQKEKFFDTIVQDSILTDGDFVSGERLQRYSNP